MSKRKQSPEEMVQTMIEKFVYYPEYRASLFVASDSKTKEPLIYIRIDHGKYKGCIVLLENFYMSDTDSQVSFEYNLVLDPRKKNPDDIKEGGHIDRVVKNIARRLIISALNRAVNLERENEERKNNPKLIIK